MTTYSATEATRKMRGGVWGPWHTLTGHGLTWCGRRIPGIADRRDVTNVPEGDRRCDACAKALAAGRPKAWRR